ncbi:MAG: TraR/DksA C4-type zinc finger protein [Candidatus Zapsychrus exili]|nr:TraR/DksA C4-type zinc finger protein [Candidatus Zapsychrus exili]
MESKEMDKKKLEFYKKMLLKIKEDLLHDVKNMAHNSDSAGNEGDVSGHVLHMADVATDMYDKEFNLGLASKDREILQKIDDALIRIEKGTYGICLGTGKKISQARLKAIPYTEHCLKHQEEIESQG